MRKLGVAQTLLLAAAILYGCTRQEPKSPPAAEEARAERSSPPAVRVHFPLLFEANQGQADRATSFVGRGTGFTASVRSDGIALSVLQGKRDEPNKPAILPARARFVTHSVGIKLKGAKRVKPVGAIHSRATANVYRDKRKPIRDIPMFEAVKYERVYPGVDMAVHGLEGALAYAFTLSPKADPEVIKLAFDGVKNAKLDDNQNLVLELEGTRITQSRPRALEFTEDKMRVLDASFVVLGKNEVGFRVEGRTPGSTLVIDPEYLLPDEVNHHDFTFGPDGSVYFVGLVPSALSPDSIEVYVERRNSADDYRTYPISMPSPSLFDDLHIDAGTGGRVYVAVNIAGVGAGGAVGGFVVLLGTDGELSEITWVGPQHGLRIRGIAFDPSSGGAVYAAGIVEVAPSMAGVSEATPGAFIEALPAPASATSGAAGFVAKYPPNLGSPLYFTYLGGQQWPSGILAGSEYEGTFVNDIDVSDGTAWVTGVTISPDFPTTSGVLQSDLAGAAGNMNGYLARLSADGSSLLSSTFIGGSSPDFTLGISVAPDGDPVVVGQFDGKERVVRLSSDLATQVAEADLGPSSVFDADGLRVYRVEVDDSGLVHVPGEALGAQTTAALGADADGWLGGDRDGFYARLTGALELDYFTYLGGSGVDQAVAVDSIASDGASCVGYTLATKSLDVEGTMDRPVTPGDRIVFYLDCDGTFPATQLQLAKLVDDGVVAAGDGITFYLLVDNTGSGPIVASVLDTLPPGLVVSSVDGLNCGSSANSVSCDDYSFSAGLHIAKIEATAECASDNDSIVENAATLHVLGQETDRSTASILIDCGDPGLNPCDACPGCDDLDCPPRCDECPVNCAECAAQCPNCTGTNCSACPPRCDECPDDCSDCSTDCSACPWKVRCEECGNGIRECDEECDDGNTTSDDGCSESCELECDGRLYQGMFCDPKVDCCATGLDCRAVESDGKKPIVTEYDIHSWPPKKGDPPPYPLEGLYGNGREGPLKLRLYRCLPIQITIDYSKGKSAVLGN